MPSANTIRIQIEASLSKRIPSALSPAPKVLRPTSPTGISTIDEFLNGGLPLGALTEMVGPECSGRTSFALSFLARLTQAGKVCAWIDVSNSLRPDSEHIHFLRNIASVEARGVVRILHVKILRIFPFHIRSPLNRFLLQEGDFMLMHTPIG